MIGALLKDLSMMLTEVQSKQFAEHVIFQQLRANIEQDLTNLSKPDGEFLDGPQGFVDYYAINAEAQMENKRIILEKYLDQTILLLAFLIRFHKLKEEIKKNKENTEFSEAWIKLKDKNIEELQQDETIARYMLQIKDKLQESKKQKELKTKVKAIDISLQDEELTEEDKLALEHEKTELIAEKAKLAEKNATFNKMIRSFGVKPLLFNIHHLSDYVKKHKKIQAKIPSGILDVKRALSMVKEQSIIKKEIETKREELQAIVESSAESTEKESRLRDEIAGLESKYAAIRLDAPESDNLQLNAMLSDLRNFMSKSIKDYQSLAIQGGDVEVFKHKTTEFYWNTLYIYHNKLSKIHDFLRGAKPCLLTNCIQQAFDSLPQESKIVEAMGRIKAAEKDISKAEAIYRIKGKNLFFFYQFVYEIMTEFLRKPESSAETMAEVEKPFFYIPYSPHSYVLDHPEKQDLADASGNCHGEAMMFLKRISASPPTINNICPERELNNYQLNETKKLKETTAKVVKKVEHKGKARARVLTSRPTAEDRNKVMTSQEVLLIHQSENSWEIGFRDKGGHYVQRIIFDTSVKNIPLLLSTHKFPHEITDQTILNSVDNYLKKESLECSSALETHVLWTDLEDFCLKEPDSEYGDLCTITLGEGIYKGKPLNHVFSLIILKNPSPYKYVVYDFNHGVMGLTHLSQLQRYVTPIPLEMTQWKRLTIEKQGEVSKETFDFLQNIAPLKRSDPKTMQTALAELPKFWTMERLNILINDGLDKDFSLKTVVTEMSSLHDEEQQILRQLLIEKVDANRLIECLLMSDEKSSEDQRFIIQILNSGKCTQLSVGESMSNKLNFISHFVGRGTVLPEVALTVFPEHKQINFAVLKIMVEDIIKRNLSLENLSDEFKKNFEMIQRIKPDLILYFIQNDLLKGEDYNNYLKLIAEAFPNHCDIYKAIVRKSNITIFKGIMPIRDPVMMKELLKDGTLWNAAKLLEVFNQFSDFEIRMTALLLYPNKNKTSLLRKLDMMEAWVMYESGCMSNCRGIPAVDRTYLKSLEHFGEEFLESSKLSSTQKRELMDLIHDDPRMALKRIHEQLQFLKDEKEKTMVKTAGPERFDVSIQSIVKLQAHTMHRLTVHGLLKICMPSASDFDILKVWNSVEKQSVKRSAPLKTMDDQETVPETPSRDLKHLLLVDITEAEKIALVKEVTDALGSFGEEDAEMSWIKMLLKQLEKAEREGMTHLSLVFENEEKRLISFTTPLEDLRKAPVLEITRLVGAIYANNLQNSVFSLIFTSSHRSEDMTEEPAERHKFQLMGGPRGKPSPETHESAVQEEKQISIDDLVAPLLVVAAILPKKEQATLAMTEHKKSAAPVLTDEISKAQQRILDQLRDFKDAEEKTKSHRP